MISPVIAHIIPLLSTIHLGQWCKMSKLNSKWSAAFLRREYSVLFLNANLFSMFQHLLKIAALCSSVPTYCPSVTSTEDSTSSHFFLGANLLSISLHLRKISVFLPQWQILLHVFTSTEDSSHFFHSDNCKCLFSHLLKIVVFFPFFNFNILSMFLRLLKIPFFCFLSATFLSLFSHLLKIALFSSSVKIQTYCLRSLHLLKIAVCFSSVTPFVHVCTSIEDSSFQCQLIVC